VCNFVFCDGHVTAVSNTIAGTTLGYLCTRMGGEVIPNY
jgi:prepilin-type processing-associated H-X9-DG protein